jgi:hypothetical protein
MLRWDLAEAESAVLRYLKEEAPPVRLLHVCVSFESHFLPNRILQSANCHFLIPICEYGQSSECR